jgi:hypothetical protein
VVEVGGQVVSYLHISSGHFNLGRLTDKIRVHLVSL